MGQGTGTYIGTDIVEVDRFRKHAVEEYSRFFRKFLTENEFNYCRTKRDPYPHIAGRFAVKEAMYKALSPVSRIDYCDAEVILQASGRPEIRIDREKYPGLSGITNVDVSISHTAEYAVATVIVQTAEND